MTTRKEENLERKQTDPGQIAQLMEGLRQGSKEAAGQLVSIFYPELRELARSRMRSERTPHTWQPTVLVNELYLRLVKVKALNAAGEGRSDREAFLGLAARIMRHMLIEHARPLHRRVSAVEVSDELDSKASAESDLAELEELLSRLSNIDPQLRTIVEMRVFEGSSIQDIASELNCAPRTIDRRWLFVRQWLQEQLGNGSEQ